MPDSLNKHGSQQSMTLDPTLQDSVGPFQKIREEAIEQAFQTYLRDEVVISQRIAFRAGIEAAASLPRVGRIGVHDYDSLVECLKENFEEAFPGEMMRDPQDAIQRLSATVMQLRRESANLDEAVRTLWTRNSELAPAWSGASTDAASNNQDS